MTLRERITAANQKLSPYLINRSLKELKATGKWQPYMNALTATDQAGTKVDEEKVAALETAIDNLIKALTPQA